MVCSRCKSLQLSLEEMHAKASCPPVRPIWNDWGVVEYCGPLHAERRFICFRAEPGSLMACQLYHGCMCSGAVAKAATEAESTPARSFKTGKVES